MATLLTTIESGEIAHAQTELLAAIDEILDAGRGTGELRADLTAVGRLRLPVDTVAC